MSNTPFGVEIRNLRQQADMSQGDLARLAGVSQVQLSRIENGQFLPRRGTIDKLYQVFNRRAVGIVVVSEPIRG